MYEILDILRLPIAMGHQNPFVVKFLLLRICGEVTECGRLDLQHLAIDAEEYVVRIFERLDLFALDCKREIKTAHVPDKHHAVVCFDRRPPVFLLRRSRRSLNGHRFRRVGCLHNTTDGKRHCDDENQPTNHSFKCPVLVCPKDHDWLLSQTISLSNGKQWIAS